MATKRPLVARDKHGKELHVNDRVRYVEAFGSAPVRVVGIGETPSRATGGYWYLPVRLPGYGWVNPVTRCIKVEPPKGRRGPGGGIRPVPRSEAGRDR